MSHKLFVKNPKWPTVDILIEVQSFHRLSNSFSLLFICCVALCFHDFMISCFQTISLSILSLFL